jgi:hypothetical protein
MMAAGWVLLTVGERAGMWVALMGEKMVGGMAEKKLGAWAGKMGGTKVASKVERTAVWWAGLGVQPWDA